MTRMPGSGAAMSVWMSLVTRLTQENTLLWLAVNEMRTEMGLHRVRPSARRGRLGKN